MGLLDKLWDDTLAGPRPENGLGRLRKHAGFASRQDSGKEDPATTATATTVEGDETATAAPRVTRSIMIKRPSGCPSPVGTPPLSPASSTPLTSPAGSTPPVSPFSGRDWTKYRRKSSSDAYERGLVGVGSRNPNSPYEV